MYAARYFATRYFPARYFPKAGLDDVSVPLPDTTGVGGITFTSSAVPRPIISPPLLDQDGGYWRATISNDGIVTLTDQASVSEGEKFAALRDDEGTLWLWQVDPCSQGEVTTQVITSSTAHRISVRVAFHTNEDTPVPFRIYSIRPYAKVQKLDVPYRYEAAAECLATRPSVRVTWTGGPFVMDTIQLRAKVLKHQVKG